MLIAASRLGKLDDARRPLAIMSHSGRSDRKRAENCCFSHDIKQLDSNWRKTRLHRSREYKKHLKTFKFQKHKIQDVEEEVLWRA